MTSRDFCFWLQGYFEIKETDGEDLVMTKEQIKMVRKHLNLVFKHEIDPSMGDDNHQAQLNEIHSSGTKPNGDALLRC